MSDYDVSGKYVVQSYDEESINAMLDKYGVAVIPRVLDVEECDQMIGGMWDTLEQISSQWEEPMSRRDATTWKSIKNLFPLHSMLIQHWSIGHAQFIWNLRQNPKCADVFSKIWKTPVEDLLVSFDGASFHMPPEVTGIGWHRNTWYHSDQSFVNTGRKCIQGWATALDVNDGDGTLAFYEGSHNHHTEFGVTFGITDNTNWYKIDDDAKMQFYIDKGCVSRKISCPRGSIVLWDSRVIHCGVEPIKGRAKPNFRCVVYLCYMPRSLSSDKNIEKKQQAFENMRTTSHWPCHIRLFPKTPRTYGAETLEMTPLPPPTVSDFGRRLAGYE
jgi:ectoine hydroxylase-related dioxygenase (phytanoyl-CoA dioxygenase family)